MKDGDDYIINGSKVFITNGYMCDVVIVVAITNPSAKSPAHGISLFLVEEGMPGFRKGQKLQKMGMKAQDTAELFFEDVRVPKSALLGKENGGFYQLMQELPQERLLLGISSMAASEWVFEETRDYLLNRKAFGKTLSNLQVRDVGRFVVGAWLLVVSWLVCALCYLLLCQLDIMHCAPEMQLLHR